MTHLLSVSHLQKSYGGVRAVKDVSFSLKAGELLALIGPNGAGKSTTFNCLNGQIKVDSGSVILNHDGEHNITNLKPHQIWRKGVGRTFQVAATFLSMSVVENVQMVLMNHHKNLWNLWRRARNQYRDQAMTLLEMVGMADHADKACSILAYGDMKRLELAMALAHNPKLLLMDEPTAGMAEEERIRLMELTHNIAKTQQIGVLFTEHDMEAVFRFSDHIIVMHRGEIIARGNAQDIRNNTQVKEIYLGKDI